MRDETLGQVFKRYREAENIKIEKIEKDKKISRRMILAIEADDYKNLPDDLYTKNIIKTYASYLSLDYNKLLNLYMAGRENFRQNSIQPENPKKIKVYLTPQRVRNIIIIVIIAALLAYLGFQIHNIYQPPQLIVYQPDKNLISSSNFIEIKGRTEKEARVFINEKEVFLDSQGNFSATLDLQKGLNMIKISAVKKQGNANTVYRQILVQ
ncbi:MAG: helix-turn-helix domain-containing protein [Candidatus Parcubacteria bacterium]|nr:helix-turn-helix domain-containing protein [Candidatus Parcubacteria bacterium]